MANPYAGRPDTSVWKRAVAMPEAREVMPIRSGGFSIDPGAKVGTAGSCFAQEVGKYLATMPGITLLTEETAGPNQPMFSALYGNIYTVRQLVQLFDRAFDAFRPSDTAWKRKDGRYVDPFRPYMFPEGFEAARDVEVATADHLSAVRRVFTNSSIFVFTLGLTEGWRATVDGATFPVAPGVVNDEVDHSGYEFHNSTYAEVVADLRGFAKRLRGVNPTVRMILTVSPVPLIATYTDDHVLVATAHSKAILRAACSEIDAEFDFVHYFPSYEIISGHFNRGAYYEPNLRTVTRAGVAHVMDVFRATYFKAPESEETDPLDDDTICDEEEIVRSVGFD